KPLLHGHGVRWMNGCGLPRKGRPNARRGGTRRSHHAERRRNPGGGDEVPTTHLASTVTATPAPAATGVARCACLAGRRDAELLFCHGAPRLPAHSRRNKKSQAIPPRLTGQSKDTAAGSAAVSRSFQYPQGE